MTTAGTTLVIGATGTTGSRTAAQLTAAGHRVKAASRRATPVAGTEPVPFDWYDPATHAAALDEADRVYLIPPLGDSDPAAIMLPFLHQARTAGVHRAVLLSSSAIPEGGPAVGTVHQALPDLFEQWAVLRPSWFMQNFTGTHAHARSIRDEGIIWTATESGRVGFVDAEDIAAVAVRALTDEQAPNTDLLLSPDPRHSATTTSPRSSPRSPVGPSSTALCPTSRCAIASRRRCRWSSPQSWPAWTVPSPQGRRTASPTPSSASPVGPRAPSGPSFRGRCDEAADVPGRSAVLVRDPA